MNTRKTKWLHSGGLFLCMLVSSLGWSQTTACGLTVAAGPDLAVCQAGQSVTLQGQLTPAQSFTWSPTAGLSNPNSLTPSATVFGTQTYTLTALVSDLSNNLITNGDFSQGNVGFTSDYVYSPTNIWLEGRYSVSASPNLVHSNFPPCDDHSPGVGPMMIVNGAGVAGEAVWCQTITVVPGALYEFSAWVGTIIPLSPAQLQFSINGVPFGNIFNAPSAICDWQEFAETWTAGSATTAEICIVNQNTAFAGNDFVLDDLSFSPVCEVTDDMTVSVVDMSIAAAPAVLPCGSGTTQLQASVPAGNDYTYQWTTTDGNIVTDPSQTAITVDAAGSYSFTLYYDDGTTQCSETTGALVSGSPPPVASVTASGTDVLNCVNTQVELNAAGGGTYQWDNSNGGLSGAPGQPVAYANQPGTYAVTVTDALGCTATADYTVTELIVPLTAAIAPPALVGCGLPPAVLDGGGSSSGAGIFYNWTTSDGNLTAINGNQATTSTPGTYTLIVTHGASGCTEQTSVTVNDNGQVLTATLTAADTFSCSNNNVQLTAGPTGAGYGYAWTDPFGQSLNASGPGTTVYNPGFYSVTVTDASGCTGSAAVSLTAPPANQTVTLSADGALTCVNTSVTLTATPADPSLTYTWTDPDGNTFVPTDPTSAEVTLPGTYSVLAAGGGCSSTATATVLLDTVPVLAVIAPPASIDCNQTPVLLDGGASSQGSDFSYSWFSTDGAFTTIDGDEATTATPGTYTLLVTHGPTGCTAERSVTVVNGAQVPQVSLGTDEQLSCGQSSVTLSVTPTDPAYTYAWTNPLGQPLNGTGATLVVWDAGTYTVAVTDGTNNCTGLATFYVAPADDLFTASIQSDGGFNCTDGTVTLEAQPVDAAFDYAWTDPNGNATGGAVPHALDVSQPGTYSVIVSNADCADTAVFLINSIGTAPSFTLNTAAVITCAAPTTTLSMATAGNPDWTYQWTTTDGTFAGGTTASQTTVSSPGSYVLTVTSISNGCTASETVTVGQSAGYPLASIAPPDTLSCLLTSFALDASASSQGAGFQYAWGTVGSAPDQFDAAPYPVTDPDTYYLIVTDAANGCSDTTYATVVENTSAPVVNTAIPAVLDCDSTSVQLLAATNGTAAVAYRWTDAAGAVIGTAASVAVSTAGDYTVAVTNVQTGCSATAPVTVAANVAEPTFSFNTPDSLLCGNSVTVGAQNLTGTSIVFAWTDPFGDPIGGNDVSLDVSVAGDYQLTITDTANGCSSTGSVAVPAAANLLQLQVPQGIRPACGETCESVTVQLFNAGPNVTYDWQVLSGNFCAPPAQQQIEAEAGSYLLTVTDPGTGCSISDTLVVGAAPAAPTQDIAPPAPITCAHQTISVSVADPTADDLAYVWATADGNILTPTNLPVIQVDAPGEYALTVTNAAGCSTQTSTTVQTQYNYPTAAAGDSPTITCTDPAVTLDASASTGSNSLSYTWTNAQGTALAQQPVFTTDQPGWYYLTVTSQDECVSVDSVAVLIDADLPVATLAVPPPLTCAAAAVALSAAGSSTGAALTYVWNGPNGPLGPATDPLIRVVDAPGSYQLTVTDTATGCSAVATQTVEQNVVVPEIDFDLPQQTLTCITTNLPFSLEVDNLVSSALSLTYDAPVGGENFLVDAAFTQAGDYLLYATNTTNACYDSLWISVAIDTLTPLVVLDAAEMLTCTTPSFELGYTAPGAQADWAYEWYSDVADLSGAGTTVTVSEAGSYGISVIDNGNGCVDADETMVQSDQTAPELTIAPPALLTCNLPEVALVANTDLPAGTYAADWSTAGGQFADTSNELAPTVSSAGEYGMVLTNTENGCTASASVYVNADQTPPLAEAGPEQLLDCDDQPVVLVAESDAATGRAYAWTAPDGTTGQGAQLAVTAAGTYTLLVTNTANGCTAADAVAVGDLRPELLLATPLPAACAALPGSIRIDSVRGGSPPYVYRLDDGPWVSNANFSGLTAGSYDVQAEDSRGCAIEAKLVLTAPLPVQVDLPPRYEITWGDSVRLNTLTNIPDSSLAIITWSPVETLNAPLQLRPWAAPARTTDYQLQVITKAGCTANTRSTVVVDREALLFAPNVFSPNRDGHNDRWFIQTSSPMVKGIREAAIYSRWGERVYWRTDFLPNDAAMGWNGTHRGEALNPAVFTYAVVVELLDGSTVLLEGDLTLMR